MRLFGWASPAEAKALDELHLKEYNSCWKAKRDLEALNDSYRVLQKGGIEERNRLRNEIDLLRKNAEYYSGLFNKVTDELNKLKAGPSPRSELDRAYTDLHAAEQLRDSAINVATSCEYALGQIETLAGVRREAIKDLVEKYRTSQGQEIEL